MKRFRFPLLAVFVIVTLVSFYLGLVSYVQDGEVTLRDVTVVVVGLVWIALVSWLVTFAPWSFQIFAIGFLVGVFVELAANEIWVEREWIEVTPPPYQPQGYYPLTLPLARLLVEAGLKKPHENPGRALACGIFLSGAIVGAIFSVTWRCWWKSKARDALPKT